MSVSRRTKKDLSFLALDQLPSHLKIWKYSHRQMKIITTSQFKASEYINLTQLALLIKTGRTVEILDRYSKQDITAKVLASLVSIKFHDSLLKDSVDSLTNRVRELA